MKPLSDYFSGRHGKLSISKREGTPGQTCAQCAYGNWYRSELEGPIALGHPKHPGFGVFLVPANPLQME